MRAERVLNRYLGGHITIGPVTLYGRNAMHWGVTIRTRRWGYVCVRLPFRCFGMWWPLYVYVSPNATPWSATFMIGGERSDRYDRDRARRRRQALGHNFRVHDDAIYQRLRRINEGKE